jgi:hypothetical protein
MNAIENTNNICSTRRTLCLFVKISVVFVVKFFTTEFTEHTIHLIHFKQLV